MFNKFNNIAIAAVFGASVLVFSGNATSAMPVTPGLQAKSTDIVPAQYMQRHKMDGNRSWQSNRDGRRCRTRFGDCRHYYRGFYYETPWWTLPLIIGSIANNSHGNAHVEWCLSRYRSYNPRTDLWLGYSGRYYHCISPY